MKNEDLNYTTVATKLSKADKEKFCNIARAFGMTFYQLIQAMFLCLVRYFDTDSHITYEHEALVNAFGNIFCDMGGDAFCPISRKGNKGDCAKRAILFVERPNLKGQQLLMITKSDDVELMENYNHDTMLEAFLTSTDMYALKALKREMRERGYFSLSHTLHEIVMQRATPTKDTMQTEVEEMFSDQRTTTGERICNDTFYIHKHGKFIDGAANRTTNKKRLKVEL